VVISALIGYLVALMYGAPITSPHYLPGWTPWLSVSLYLLHAMGIVSLIDIMFAVMGVIYVIKSGKFSKASGLGEILKLIEEIE
jgi:hypothetical protein